MVRSWSSTDDSHQSIRGWRLWSHIRGKKNKKGGEDISDNDNIGLRLQSLSCRAAVDCPNPPLTFSGGVGAWCPALGMSQPRSTKPFTSLDLDTRGHRSQRSVDSSLFSIPNTYTYALCLSIATTIIIIIPRATALAWENTATRRVSWAVTTDAGIPWAHSKRSFGGFYQRAELQTR